MKTLPLSRDQFKANGLTITIKECEDGTWKCWIPKRFRATKMLAGFATKEECMKAARQEAILA